MKKSILFFCLLSAFSINVSAQKVAINLTNIKEAKGNIMIGIYNSPVNFTKVGSEIKRITVPADSETVRVMITDLEEGEYAFTVLHDKNANGKCDYNLFGIPKESIGFSNNVKPKLKVPSFNDVKIKIKDNFVLNIKLLTL